MGEGRTVGVHPLDRRRLGAVDVEDTLDEGDRPPTVVGELGNGLAQFVRNAAERELEDTLRGLELERGAIGTGIRHDGFLNVHFLDPRIVLVLPAGRCKRLRYSVCAPCEHRNILPHKK